MRQTSDGNLNYLIFVLILLALLLISIVSTVVINKASRGSESGNTALQKQREKLVTLEQKIQDGNTDPSTLGDYAYALYVTGNAEKAIEVHTQLLDENATDTRTLLNLGNLYRSSRDYENAIATYNQVLAIDETEINARINLAHLYLYDLDSQQEAYTQFDSLLELHPEKGYLHAMVARIYAGQYETELAKKAYAKAIELDPTNEALVSEYQALPDNQ